jgi:hypothetical protein
VHLDEDLPINVNLSSQVLLNRENFALEFKVLFQSGVKIIILNKVIRV